MMRGLLPLIAAACASVCAAPAAAAPAQAAKAAMVMAQAAQAAQAAPESRPSAAAARVDRWPAISPNAPVVIELFTAQGCSACVAANAAVADWAAQEDVLALTYGVDYWDYLGWKDTFARPEFTARQRGYLKPLGQRDPYTPQVVIDGRAQVSAARRDRMEALLDQAARRRPDAPDIQLTPAGRAAVGSGRPPKGGADVWLVRFDPRVQEVQVRRGENRGETIPHANVVRQLVKLGPWTGRPRLFRLPEPVAPGLRAALLVQSRDGRILGARLQDLPPGGAGGR